MDILMRRCCVFFGLNSTKHLLHIRVTVSVSLPDLLTTQVNSHMKTKKTLIFLLIVKNAFPILEQIFCIMSLLCYACNILSHKKAFLSFL